MSDAFFEYSRVRDQRDRLLALVNRAIGTCRAHIIPNGFSADVSMAEMIEIFDSPEQRAAMSSDPVDDALRALPVMGVLNVDNPKDPRHKEWGVGSVPARGEGEKL